MNDDAKRLIEPLLRKDPEIDYRIESGIENNRKGFGEILLIDADGKPVEAATIHLKQVGHEFHFGCNGFLLNQLPEEEKNARYKELFAELFNLAVVPFYWCDLEPTEGELRFDRDSRPIYRRPPPDMVLDFCAEHGMTPKAHPLMWHSFRPDWLPFDEASMRKHIRRRFRQIAERYADRINIWDVCNEAQSLQPHRVRWVPENHVELAFDLAKEFFPNGIKTYNDDCWWFRYSNTYSPVYLLVKSLLDGGYRVDALGVQYHMFEGTLRYPAQSLSPGNLFDSLDLLWRLRLPINVSEISILGRSDLGDGNTFQRLAAERLYRLWFSHPAMNGITWWNLVDGTAAFAPLGSEGGENLLRAGLADFDVKPKPAYAALHHLIKKEWNTRTTLEYREGAVNKFRGFYGDYEATVKTNAGTSIHRLKFSKTALNRITLRAG